MSHKCACCFPQASPGCGYKWYYIFCWHPVLTMLAPHLHVQDTSHFLHKFLHVPQVPGSLAVAILCQFDLEVFFFFLGIAESFSCLCIHTLLSGGAASAGQSLCFCFVWHISWYLPDIIVTLVRFQSGSGFYQSVVAWIPHPYIERMWCTFGGLSSKASCPMPYYISRMALKFAFNGTISYKSFGQALRCYRDCLQDNLFYLTSSFFLELSP